MASSSQSSDDLSLYIEQLINGPQIADQVDLDQLIKKIDDFLRDWKTNRSKKSRKELLSSYTSGTAQILEGVSNNMGILDKQLSQFSGNGHSTAVKVLEAAGTVHWAGLSLLLVAAVLKRLDTIKQNKEERLGLLNSMNELAKVVQKLNRNPSVKSAMRPQIKDSIALVVQGAILCCSQKNRKRWRRFCMASEDANDLKALGSQLDEMYRTLNINVEAHNLLISANTIHQPPHIPFDQNAVGIQDKVDEVVKLLQWENDSTPSLAVVVHGLGGSGKTTLADAVYHSLTDPKPTDWKYSKIVLPQEEKEYRDVKELQDLILQHLTGENKKVTDIKEGQERLREIMGKQPIFLYIDNALFGERLQELLPRSITNPKKLRLLVTAREANISDVMANCMIEHEIYSMKDLPIDIAKYIICRNIDPARDTTSLLEERPEIENIAEVFNCCPLFLEVVGGFLRSRNNKKEAYDRVFKWMESGEPFSGNKKHRFDEERIMFAYDQLESSPQEAFLDICSFFYDWDWEVVAQIVGEEEMKCLHDGALIKRERQKSNWNDKILIHDLLLSAGRRKSKDNRFRTPEEFTQFLQKDKGKLPQVKGVWLTHKEWECRGPIDVGAEVLDAMSESLRVFAMGQWTLVEGKCSKRFDELRFLNADPGSDLPMDLSKLAGLTYISCSWEIIKSSELKDMPELKVADIVLLGNWVLNASSELGCCEKLRVLTLRCHWAREIPDLVNLGHLRKLDLSESYFPSQLPESLGKLESLEELDLSDLTELEQLPLGFEKLEALVVLDLRNCRSLKELPMNCVNLSSLQRLNLQDCRSLRELPSSFEKLTSLEYLNLKRCSELISLPERLGELTRLTEIHFSKCTKLSNLPQSLGGLSSLLMSQMYFDNCSSLTELPDETSWLSRMTQISLRECSSLKRIPSQFSKLSCLEKLCLDGCKGIEELWNDFHGLEALRELNMRQCRSLSTLPQGFGKLKSLKSLYLSECDNLRTLCDDFHCLGALEHLDLSRCHSFDKLKSLKSLYLSGCDKLKELCDNFHCLEELTELNLSSCCGIAKLPNCFGELRSLQTLNLSQCSKLEELCGDFHRLAALKVLDMSGCCSLTKLPDSFGQLVCLEKADFSGCLNLALVSDDFQSLPSLLRLDLSNCSKLGAECMDRVGATQSLWYANISQSEAMSQRWEQMQREKEEWHFAVETDSFYEGRGETCTGTSKEMWVSVVEMITWKIFSTEGLLIDASGPPLYLSSLPSHVRLVLITDRHWSSQENLKKVLSNLERQEHCSSRELRVIYVGGKYNALPSELADRIVAYSTPTSWIHSVTEYFRDVLPESFFGRVRRVDCYLLAYDVGVFASTIDIAEGGTVKYSSTWEDISDIQTMNEVEIITRNPRDGNGELLRKLCETPENSFLLRKNEEVKVKDLEGKLVLLFRTHSGKEDKLKILALEDVYLKLQTSSDYRAEVVWIPSMREYEDGDRKEYLRAAARAPWPRVPKPWLIDEDNWEGNCVGYGRRLVVVDEKGKISHTYAMTMILRWGIKAYPFSAIREQELRDTEWNKFKSSSQSSCQFIFQNLEHFQLKATEALRRGETIFMCVGSINKMHQFLPELNNALEKLESVVQVFYVGEGVQYTFLPTRRFYEEEKEYEMKRNEMESVTSLSRGDAYKFWEHAKCLCKELGGQGVDKRIVQVRGMVLAFLSACEWRDEDEEEGKGISIVAVDENGEMMNGHAEEVVQLLFQSKGEEEHQKLMGEIKSEGFNNVLRRRWINGRIHPKHDPHHPLVTNHSSLLEIGHDLTKLCDACSHSKGILVFCGDEITPAYQARNFYRCSVCEKYKMCEDCFEC